MTSKGGGPSDSLQNPPDPDAGYCRELGVEVISPVMGSAPDGLSLADFTFSDADEMIACPQRQKPQRTKTGKHGGKIVYFDMATCDNCHRQSDCQVKRVKRSTTLSYNAKLLRLARRRAAEKTEAFRELYRFRAGSEGTMSDLDRITGIKRLRVRGMRQVRLAAVLKATGLNTLHATAFKNCRRGPKMENEGPSNPQKGLVGVVKEQYRRLRDYLRELSEACPPRRLPNGPGPFIAQAA